MILHTVAEEAFCKKCRIASADGRTFEVVECFGIVEVRVVAICCGEVALHADGKSVLPRLAGHCCRCRQ